MSTLDSSMVNIALPTIMADFNSQLRDTEWVVLIYLLTITSSLLIWGSLSDRVGRHKIYPMGLLIFAGGSLACAYAPQLSCLIGARFAQALGAGMMMSTGPAIIKETFPADQLGRGLGMVSIAVSLGLMSGPILGGFLLEYYSWRSLFWITVPIGLIFALAGKALIPRSTPDPNPGDFNRLSATVWVTTLVFFSIAANYVSSPVWSKSVFAGLGTLACLSFLLFSWLESKSSTPFLPTKLIRNRYFYSSLICAALSFMVLFDVLILTPFFLDRVLHTSKAQIGLIMMTIPVAVMLVAPTAGWLSEKISAKKLSTLGLIFSTAGVLLMSRLTATSSQPEIIIKLALLGCGQALFLAPNSASVLKKVTSKDSGKAAALLATARNLGMLLGICMASLVFSYLFSTLTGGLDLKDFSLEHTESFMAALNGSFLSVAVFGFVASIISWLRDN